MIAHPAIMALANKLILKVARELGVGSGTAQRVRQEMTGPFADAAA